MNTTPPTPAFVNELDERQGTAPDCSWRASSSSGLLADDVAKASQAAALPPARKKKIAFIRMRDFPIANQSVAQVLRSTFPEFELDVIDVIPLVRERRTLVYLNSLFMLNDYWLALALKYRRAWNCFFTTPFLFRRLNRLLAERLTKENYIFSFQMQSLFDASLPGLPHFVYTDHTFLVNLTYPGFDWRKMPTANWLRLEKSIYENASRVFVRSTHVERSLIEQYHCHPERVVCIYAGPNVEARGSMPSPSRFREKRILYVGIDWERKGGPELVEAYRRVLIAHPDASLIVVGCEPAIDLPNCEVVGKVPPSELASFYERASLFCLPTKVEPFGIVFVEALHHGLPIVASHIGAVPDMVSQGRNGYLVPVGEVQPLADALIGLLADPEKCRRFGEASRQLGAERYTWENVGIRMRHHILDRLHQVSVAESGPA